MRKRLLITLCALQLSLGVNAQDFLWAKSFGSTGWDYGNSIAVDDLGNVYTAGVFEATVDFDPGVGTTNLSSNGGSDAFIQKMDASGNLIWVKSFGGTGYEEPYSLAIDASGNIYTTGYFQDTVDFDPSAGTTNLSSNGGIDAFVQKMDASGNFLWAKSFGSTNDDQGLSLTVDTSGNVYITGTFSGTVDFDPGVGTTNLSSNGGRDVFIQKMDASGNLIWVKSFGGTGYDESKSLTIDASGNIYTIGLFSHTVDFDPGTGTTNLSSNGGIDAFVQKMDASGNFIWAKSFGGTSDDRGGSITTDASGNIYSAGYFSNTVDFDPGTGTTNLSSNGNLDVFVQKMDASGNFIWAKSFGGTNNDYGNSITLDGLGNVYTTGTFQSTVDFDPSTGTTNLSSNGSSDAFIQKMDASGNFIWAKSFGGTNGDYGFSIITDGSGNAYTTGGFESSTVDFDPSTGITNLNSNGGADSFIQKIVGDSALGVISNNFGDEFNAYPNPTNGDFSIDLGEMYKTIKTTIIDINGRIIQSSEFNNSKILNMKIEAPAGFYIMTIESEEQRAVIRLIKQ